MTTSFPTTERSGGSSASGACEMRVVHANNTLLNEGFVDNTMRSTKYTFWTFLPLNLSEQFSRHQNRYYLLIACLQLISIITPVSPVSTWAPLIVVFAIAAAKEGLDDRGRAQQDRQANERLYSVVKDGELQELASESIRVGDVVRISDGEQIPCDLLLLATSEPDGSCLVQTMNLDGETNLKTRRALPDVQALDVAEVERFDGVVQCLPPNASVYRFDARLWMSAATLHDRDQALSLQGEQLLQQTITLKNTEFVYGLVIYTGGDTKFSQNMGKTHVKWTKVDAYINYIAVCLFIFQLVLVVIFGTIGNVWKDVNGERHYYLLYSLSSGWYTFCIIPLRFLLLNSTIIPISLKVTLDVCKFYYSRFINWDLRMFANADDPTKDYEPAKANNTAISEDLGQIEYVLSDKTGTLTENNMVFRSCSAGGRVFDERDCRPGGRLYNLCADAKSKGGSAELDLILNFVLNNAVVPTRDASNHMRFQSPSPDEEALVEAAAVAGVKLVSRDGPNLEVNIHGRVENYLILHELSFTSDRRRMSVVVRNRSVGPPSLSRSSTSDVPL